MRFSLFSNVENHEENVEKPGNPVENTAENVKNPMETLCKARRKRPVTADGQGKGGCGKQAGVVWAAIG